MPKCAKNLSIIKKYLPFTTKANRIYSMNRIGGEKKTEYRPRTNQTTTKLLQKSDPKESEWIAKNDQPPLLGQKHPSKHCNRKSKRVFRNLFWIRTTSLSFSFICERIWGSCTAQKACCSRPHQAKLYRVASLKAKSLHTNPSPYTT